MVKREELDTTQEGTGGQTLKHLSNDVVYMFYTDERVQKVVEMFYNVATNPEEKTADRLKAGEQILDRVLGKPKQTIEGNLKTNMESVNRDILVKALKDYDIEQLTNGNTTADSQVQTTN